MRSRRPIPYFMAYRPTDDGPDNAWHDAIAVGLSILALVTIVLLSSWIPGGPTP